MQLKDANYIQCATITGHVQADNKHNQK